MIIGKRILLGVSAALLLAGGIGAGIAATEGSRDGRGHGGWHSRSDGDGHGRGGSRARPTEEEIDARVRERFARIDRNSDGVIDRSEVEAMVSEGRRQPGGSSAGRGMRMAADENRDGKITRDEFLNSIKRRFADMDLDGDGKITEADLPPMLRGTGILAGGGRSAMEGRGGRGGGMGPIIGRLKAADINRDGVVTLDEALESAGKQFARLDRNGDGVADQADRDLMGKEMADYRVLRFLHRFGAAKDGKITREQFTKTAKERMARMDDGLGGGAFGGAVGGFDARRPRGYHDGGQDRPGRGDMRERRRWRSGEGGAPDAQTGPPSQGQPPAQSGGAAPIRP